MNRTVQLQGLRLMKFGHVLERWAGPALSHAEPAKVLGMIERTNRRCCHLAKDFEATIARAIAWVFAAHIRLLTRRIARPCYQMSLFESDSEIEQHSILIDSLHDEIMA